MLSVLSVAYPLARVGPDAVGGAEQVLSAIDAALVAAGHHSIVLACRGSKVAGELVSVEAGAGALTPDAHALAAARYRWALAAILRERRIDLVHFHGCDVARYALDGGLLDAVPKLVTLHVPAAWYDASLFEARRGLWFNCVSDWQRRELATRIPVCAVIGNGVDLERWRPSSSEPGDYAACLGRICEEKGYDEALRAAHTAGVALDLAGQVYAYPEHERYFSERIVPLLDDRRRYVGPLAGSHKRRFLARARCLVLPSRVAETSSLVVMESLACGTPVIVPPAGAPATLIEPGVTGYIADGERELARALACVGALQREACRVQAERHFDGARMTQAYLDLYRQLASGSREPVRAAMSLALR